VTRRPGAGIHLPASGRLPGSGRLANDGVCSRVEPVDQNPGPDVVPDEVVVVVVVVVVVLVVVL
jgi:hypothetical protein